MHRLRSGSTLLFVQSLFMVAFLALSPRHSSAQGTPTGSKAMDLAAFGGYINADPDNNNSKRISGVGLGADFTRYFHFPVAPSLELRYNYASGTRVTEASYLAGLRVQVDVLRRLHPYGDFLIGYGTIHYNVPLHPGYTGDNAAPRYYGGGIDLDVTGNFQARIDYQAQHWNFGVGNVSSPTAVMIGVRYVIPFRPYVSMR